MEHNLTTISNLQYEAVAIPQYTVLELYKDSVLDDNYVGYYIVPIEGLTKEEIKTKLLELAGTYEGYSYVKLLVSKDETKEQFKYKRVYGVYFNNTEPVYPTVAVQEQTIPTGTLVDVWQTNEIENGGIEVPCSIKLTAAAGDESIEFYLNNNHVSIEKYEAGEVVISSIAKNNGKTIECSFDEIPTLKNGTNILKTKATNITKVEVEFTEAY